jgi:hypothetical protein
VEWFRQQNRISSPGDIEQKLWQLMELQKIAPTDQFVRDTVKACEVYYHRMMMEDNKSANPYKDIEKFLSRLTKLNRGANALGYEARLEIGYLVEKLREIEADMDRLVSKIKVGKGRPETWARDCFISDLASLYYKHTKKIPKPPYRKDVRGKGSQVKTVIDGPFFRFVKDLLSIVKNSTNMSDAALRSAIHKIIESERKLFSLRKKHWPNFSAAHPWDRVS